MGKPQENHRKMEVYPLVMTNIAIENDHRNVVSFPMKNGHCQQLNVYQRVKTMAMTSHITVITVRTNYG